MASRALCVTSLLLYVVATLCSAATNTTAYAASSNSATAAFLPESIQNALFVKEKKDMPGVLCPAASINYERIGTIPLRADVFWVPHSRIIQEGVRCGSGQYGLLSEYMLVLPGEYLASEKVAQARGLKSVWYQIQKNKLGAMALRVLSNSKVFVGIESTADRRCGKTVYPQGSIFVFVRPTADVNLGFAMFAKDTVGMLSILQSPQKLCAFVNGTSSKNAVAGGASYNTSNSPVTPSVGTSTTQPAPTGDNSTSTTQSAPTGDNSTSTTQSAPTGDNSTSTTQAASTSGDSTATAQAAPAVHSLPVELKGLVLKKIAFEKDIVQCPSTNIVHEAVAPSPQRGDLFFVPHSAIVNDGVRCGTGSSAEFMLLVNGSSIATEEEATRRELKSFWDRLQQNTKASSAFRLFAQMGNVFVGFESTSDRKCGGKVVFPQGSVLLFLRPGLNLNLGFGKIPKTVLGMVSVLTNEKFCAFADAKLANAAANGGSNPNTSSPSTVTEGSGNTKPGSTSNGIATSIPATGPTSTQGSGNTKPGPSSGGNASSKTAIAPTSTHGSGNAKPGLTSTGSASSAPAAAPASGGDLGFKPPSLTAKVLKQISSPGKDIKCPSASIIHSVIEPIAQLKDVFKIQHKSIFQDHQLCGTGNDMDYMLVVNGKTVVDQESATSKGLKFVFDLLQKDERKMGALRALIPVGPVYVGIEVNGDRRCGGKVTFPRYSTFLFIHSSLTSLNFGMGKIPKSAIGMVSIIDGNSFCVYGTDAIASEVTSSTTASQLAGPSAATKPADPSTLMSATSSQSSSGSTTAAPVTSATGFQPPLLSGMLMKQVSTGMEGSQCPSADILFSKVSLDPQFKDLFKVLHSDIMQDRQVCGTGSSSESLSIVHAQYLLDENVATAHGVKYIFDLLSKDTRKMKALRSLHSVKPVYVGVEATSDRRCGGKVVFPRGSIFIFIGPTHFRFDGIANYSVGMLALFDSKGFCAYANGNGATQAVAASPSAAPTASASRPSKALSDNSFKLDEVQSVPLYKSGKEGGGIECPSGNITHEKMASSQTRTDVFWVPHSLIIQDGVRCGTGAPSEYMTVVNGADVASEKIAAERKLSKVWNELKKNERGMNAFLSLNSIAPVFVGIEMTVNRQCGSKIPFPRSSVFIFVKPPEQEWRVGFANFHQSKVGMISVLMNQNVCGLTAA